MSSTAKISISVPDPLLLAWAKKRSSRTGVSLSAVFAQAAELERQHEAMRQYLDSMGKAGDATAEEIAEVISEWTGGPMRRRTGPAAARKRKRAASRSR